MSASSSASPPDALAGGERVEHEAREARREDGVALGDPLDRVGELGARDRLRHVAARAGADDADHVLGRVGDRQREELHARPLRRDPGDHALAAAVAEVDVEQDDVGVELADQRHRLRDAAGLADDVDGLAELAAHAGAEELVVVDEHDAPLHARALGDRQLDLGSLARRGDDRRGAADARMRPSIDSVMPWRSAGTAARSNPAPRSRTNTVRLLAAALGVDRDLLDAGELRRVRHRLARGEHELLEPVVERLVAGARRARSRTPWSSSTSAAASPSASASEAPAAALAAVEPAAELPLLPPRERRDARGVAGVPLDERERLQDGVVDPRRDLGALLGADPLGCARRRAARPRGR